MFGTACQTPIPLVCKKCQVPLKHLQVGDWKKENLAFNYKLLNTKVIERKWFQIWVIRVMVTKWNSRWRWHCASGHQPFIPYKRCKQVLIRKKIARIKLRQTDEPYDITKIKKDVSHCNNVTCMNRRWWSTHCGGFNCFYWTTVIALYQRNIIDCCIFFFS